MTKQIEGTDTAHIQALLEAGANATRQNRKRDVPANHSANVLIYDVLAPMKYESAEAYRRSWDEWQPDPQGEAQFGLEGLSITAGADVAFTTSFIRCGGTLPNGRTFEDQYGLLSVCRSNQVHGLLCTSTYPNHSVRW